MGNCCKKDSVIDYACNREVFMRNFINWNNVDDSIPMLTFKGKRFNCKVVSVYDGDTIKVIFPLNGVLYKWNCRLTGVDTPELRTRHKLEKEKGYIVRDELRKKILNKVVTLECGDLDKYGRLLVKIICDDGKCRVDEWLIESGYAFYYEGGTKTSWAEFLDSQVLENDK